MKLQMLQMLVSRNPHSTPDGQSPLPEEESSEWEGERYWMSAIQSIVGCTDIPNKVHSHSAQQKISAFQINSDFTALLKSAELRRVRSYEELRRKYGRHAVH